MPFINVGAVDDRGGRFKSKAAMIRAIKADPSKVQFYGTSGIGTTFHGSAEEFKMAGLNAKLSVCGPDPERQRNWYGTVEVVKGAIKAT